MMEVQLSGNPKEEIPHPKKSNTYGTGKPIQICNGANSSDCQNVDDVLKPRPWPTTMIKRN